MSTDHDPELEFYRAVEDLFATLRGVPHVFSPKDFQLLRKWWREEIPLLAVRAGITEVFARHQERGDAEPIVSLSYCRHAVRAHAKRAAEMQVGAADVPGGPPPLEAGRALGGLADHLAATATRLRPERPELSNVIERFAGEVEAAAELPGPMVEEHLFALESALLSNCLEALDEPRRKAVEERARSDAEKTAATPEARDRTYRALRDRLLREDLDLPRLELDG